MGRPSKLTEAQWEQLTIRVSSGESLTKVSRYFGISVSAASQRTTDAYRKKLKTEKPKKSTLEFEISYEFESSLLLKTHSKDYGLEGVKSYLKEFSIKQGRADFVLFHHGKKITIVEVKGTYKLRDIVAGIGQLYLYEAMFAEKWKGYKIDKILLSACDDDQLNLVESACKNANIKFIRHVEV